VGQGAKLCELAWVKQQRLRARAGDKPTSQRSRRYTADIGRSTKAESRSGAIGQSPKAGQVMDPGANLWDRGQHSKLNCPTLLGEELTRQELQLKDSTIAAW
jgi:hypothetical protein